MTNFEPITTREQYEAAREMARKYEERLTETQLNLARKTAELDIEHAQKLERLREIIANLKTKLWELKAQCHDYELNGEVNDERINLLNFMGGNEVEPRGSWAAEVTSLSDLIHAAALNPEYEQYLVPNQTALNKMARKLKRTMYIPGVVATQKEKS